MKVFIALVAGHDPEGYKVTLDAAKLTLENIKAQVRMARERISREHGSHVLDAYNQEWWTAAGWTALSDLAFWEHERREQALEIKRLAAAVTRPATADSIMLTVIGAHQQREELKARQYHFKRNAYWYDANGLRVQAGWTWRGSLEATVAEIDWLRSLGAEIVINGPLNAFNEVVRACLAD